MRIQVVFNSTPVLVPCGDGHLTVGELIQKAIVRFKKVVNKVRVGWGDAFPRTLPRSVRSLGRVHSAGDGGGLFFNGISCASSQQSNMVAWVVEATSCLWGG